MAYRQIGLHFFRCPFKNSAEFLKLAEEKLKSQTVEGKKNLRAKELIDQSVETIAKTLTEMQHKLSEVEKGER